MKNFKFKASFNSPVTFRRESLANYKATAGIDELKELESLLPTKEEVEANPDFLFFSGNLFVSSLINLNSHGVLNDTAIVLASQVKYRPVDVEHNRDHIIGCLLSSSYVSFPDNKILSESDISDTKEPFNVCVSGLIWKSVDSWAAEYIKESVDPSSYCYKDISLSWEVGFDDYALALDSKNLSKAEIITDPVKVKELSKHLTTFGGNGFTKDNREVYLVITGNVQLTGVGVVRHPAAAVEGLCVVDLEMQTKASEEAKIQDTKDNIADIAHENRVSSIAYHESVLENLKKLEKSEKLISQNTKIILKRVKPMKFKDLDEFCDMYVEASAKNESIAMSDMRDFIKEQILKKEDEWKATIAVKEQKEAELQAAVDAGKENAKELDKVKAELAELQLKQAETEANRVYDARMAELNDKYDLTEKVAKVIAKCIRNKSDEDYQAWLENEGEVILAGKEKKVEVIDPADAVKTAQASLDHVPNASDTTQVVEKKVRIPVVSTKDGKNLIVSFKQS